MRPLLCLAAVLASGFAAGMAVPGGGATTATPGDGCLVVQGGYGRVTVTLTQGVVFGRYSEGTLVYNDQGGDLHLPTVPGVQPTHNVGDHLWKYADASFVRFRAQGPTKLTINAQFLNLSVAGRGYAFLSAADWNGVPFTLNPPSNAFSVDSASFCGDNFQRIPVKPTKYLISAPIAVKG